MAKEQELPAGMRTSGTESAIKILMIMDSEGRLPGLRADVKVKVQQLLVLLALAGYGQVRVICGGRSLGSQRARYGMGRTAEECEAAGVPASFAQPKARKVSWVWPEASMHVKKRAADLDLGAYGAWAYPILKKLTKMVGLKWGGNWKVRDYGHVEA